jgi:ABC-2 type transport system permease protein
MRRDRGTIVIALTIPLFQLCLFGFIDQSVKNVPTVIVDQDNSRDSRELMDRLKATKTFRIHLVTQNPHEARDEITRGRAKVGLVIPPDYHDKRLRGSGAKVLVLIDGSDSNVSAQALGAINGLAAELNIEAAKEAALALGRPFEPAVGAQPIVLFNPDGRTANFIIPGLVAILLQLVATVLTAVAVVRERERGTLEQLLVTPLHPLGLMMGKLMPYLMVGLGESAGILTVMRFGFGVPIRGSLVFLFVMALVYLFALLSLGLFISTRAQTQAQAQQMSQFILLPSIFLSGYIFPASGLPFVLRTIGRCLPATHMVEIMRGVVLRNAGPLDLLPNVATLLGMSTFLVWMSVRRFQKVSI